MALRARSSFLYGFAVTELNQWIDFRAVNAGPQLSARIDVGYYSLSGLLRAIKAAMEVVDTAHVYSVTADRSIAGGTENRITITTTGSFLSLLFSTGTHAVSSVRDLIGFPHTDKTGSTTYTGSLSAGTLIISTLVGYNYNDPAQQKKVFGNVNISASGEKEAVVWQIQQFAMVTFKYEPEDTLPDWEDFLTWSIQQRPFDFTPEITSPNTFFEMTMDKTSADGQALAYVLSEMLPEFPFHYQTNPLTMRLVIL